MKYILFTFISLLSIQYHQAQVMWQLKNDTTQKWFLRIDDEFSMNQLNTKIWRNGYPWGNYIINLDLLYKNENISFDNDAVILTAKKEKVASKVSPYKGDSIYFKRFNKFPDAENNYSFDYTSGAFCSNISFKYGYFEMRFKANDEYGVWPAFWLYGGNPNEEIDFYEGKGERRNQIHVDVHCPDGCENYRGGFLNLKKNWGAWIKTKKSLSNDWNIISGEVQPGYVKFFFNGEAFAYFKGDFKTEQGLIINHAVARNGFGFAPGPNETTKFPNNVQIDYVRVWSKEDTMSQNFKFEDFETSYKNITESKLYETEIKKKEKFVYNSLLDRELGTITLLPILYNKYSLSIAGKNLGEIKVEVFDRFDKKVAGYTLNNTEYYIMDLSALPTGPYQIKIQVANQVLTNELPIINPEKIGEQ